MKKNCIAAFTLATIMALAACGGKKEEEKNTGKNETPATETKNTAPETAKTEKATVSFKVNGVEANTKMAAGNDNAEQLGMFQQEIKSLQFTLNGDDPKFPHRGYLDMTIDNFNLQPGSFTSKTAGFSRYETANAGGETQYDVRQSGNCSIKIESFVKTSSDADSFTEYAASGTFSGKFGLKQGWKNDVKEINITDGVFKDVRVVVFGKKK